MSIFDLFRGDEVQKQIRRLAGDGRDRDKIYSAMLALQEIGERAVPPLVEVLLDRGKPPALRSRAAGTLAMLKDERAVEPLVNTLGDSDVEVRWTALKALVKLGERRAVPALERMAVSDEGRFSITPELHIVMKEEARKAIEQIETGRKQ
jgi:HEAT repeat protein